MNPTPARRTRSTIREDVRTPAAEARQHVDANGQPIVRVKRGTDKYAMPPNVSPPDGFVYQWNAISVLGQEDRGAEAEIYNAGWRPVPAERHQGAFLPPGSTGPIVIGGLRLDERPIELHREAQAEEIHAARAQVMGSREQFGLQTKFDTQSPQARQRNFVRSSFEPVEAPAPKHQLEVD